MSIKPILICNPDEDLLIDSQHFEIVDSPNVYNRLRNGGQLAKAEKVIIVAELNWEAKKLSSFQGFDLIKDIRLNLQSKNPILVLSHLPFSSFDFELKSFTTGNVRFFRDPSISFSTLIDFEFTPFQNLGKCFKEGLEDELHTFLCERLYSDTGYIDEETLELHDEIYSSNTDQSGIDIISKYFNKVINTFPEKENEVYKIRNEFYTNIETFPRFSNQEVLRHIPKLKEKINDVLPEEEVSAPQNNSLNNDIRFGEVLYVDSNDRFGNIVKEKLGSFGITSRLAYDVNEAIDILKKDTKNKITVLVCDNRFFNKEKIYNRKQSYHISKELAALPNIVNVITLCGLSTRKLASSAMQHKRMVIPMLKKDVFDTPWGLDSFCNTVKQLNVEAVSVIEKPSSFTGDHQYLYKVHREAKDYEQFEEDISSTAFYFVKKIVENGSIPKYLLPNISGRLGTKNHERNLENFRNILLARRFILGLCQLPISTVMRFEDYNSNVKVDRKDWWYIMYNALKNGELKLNLDDIDEPELNMAFNRSLKMSLKRNYNWQVSKNYALTVEEKNWLSKEAISFAEIQISE
ncbi:MAG: hypothetical protein CMO01_25620 [Thalassobius sp.]|nr:hypothetical protein [Thalassovita sp.]